MIEGEARSIFLGIIVAKVQMAHFPHCSSSNGQSVRRLGIDDLQALYTRGGSGLSPTRARARPSRFFDVFRVPEPEVFESGLGPTWPEPERKARGYPKLTFLQS